MYSVGLAVVFFDLSRARRRSARRCLRRLYPFDLVSAGTVVVVVGTGDARDDFDVEASGASGVASLGNANGVRLKVSFLLRRLDSSPTFIFDAD